MSEQRHIIQRQVIELAVRDAAQAGRLHDHVSRICRQRIAPLIEQVCSELSASDRLYRIERLELEIGTIDEHDLEADLTAKVSAALRQALAARIGAQEHDAGRSEASARTDAWLELIAIFARTGSLPWWADAATPRLIESALRRLLHAPEPLRRLMRELVREQGPLQRIVAHIPDDVLALLVESLVPALQAPQTDQLPALLELMHRTPSAANRTPSQPRRRVWGAIVQTASLAGRQYTSAELFYQAALQRVAAGLGAPYDVLLTDMRRVAQAEQQRGPGGLTQLLEALERARTVAASADRAAPASRPPSPAVTQLLTAREDGGTTGETASRILEPPGSQSLALEERAPPSFSEADVLYIGNAGLVILWPFLSSFFARLDLLEGKQFKDRATQQRAAGLLQYVATGDAACPEYLLPLNKLLCGLELAEAFDVGEPLRNSEAAECADLLHAAIAQASILRDMSLRGFQGSFLLRQGALSVRDGGWLLRVERQTYDLVLDRFPWGWEWVKLPWMDAPLRVEW